MIFTNLGKSQLLAVQPIKQNRHQSLGYHRSHSSLFFTFIVFKTQPAQNTCSITFNDYCKVSLKNRSNLYCLKTLLCDH
jgi:hypothetical protein